MLENVIDVLYVGRSLSDDVVACKLNFGFCENLAIPSEVEQGESPALHLDQRLLHTVDDGAHVVKGDGLVRDGPNVHRNSSGIYGVSMEIVTHFYGFWRGMSTACG